MGLYEICIGLSCGNEGIDGFYWWW